MAKIIETKRMLIEDMPDDVLNSQREPVDFDTLMDKALHREKKEDNDSTRTNKGKRLFPPSAQVFQSVERKGIWRNYTDIQFSSSNRFPLR